MSFEWYNHLLVGGFAFGIVFMATDPVSAAQTTKENGCMDSSWSILYTYQSI